MERMATICRFLQLLLEFKEPADDDTSDTRAEMVVPSLTGDVQICQMVVQIIRQVSSVLCEALALSTPAFSASRDSAVTMAYELYRAADCRDGLDVRLVAVMAFGALHRLNMYCTSRPFLLSVVWKSLGEIADPLPAPPPPSTAGDTSVRLLPPPLPSAVVQPAVVSLLEHVSNGTQSLIRTCTSVLSSPKRDDTNAASVEFNEQAFAFKVLGFLLARLTVFFKLLEGDDSRSVLTSTVRALATLQGVSCLLESFATTRTDDAAVVNLQSYRNMTTKVERAIAAWIGTDQEALSNLTEMIESARNSELDSSEQSRSRCEAHGEVATASIYIGKVLFLTTVLHCAMSNTGSVWSNHQWSESLLLAVEELLLRSLPMALESMDSVQSAPHGSAQLLRHSLQSISDVLLQIELEINTSVESLPWMRRFHSLLLHWLGLGSGTHPLARDIVLEVIVRHVSHRKDFNNATYVLPLLTLITQIFLDERTAFQLRASAAAMLLRLLSETPIKKTLRKLLIGHLGSIGIPPPTSKRGAAAGSNRVWDDEAMRSLLSVLCKIKIEVDCEFLDWANQLEPFPHPSVQSSTIRIATSNYSSKENFVRMLKNFLKAWNTSHFSRLSQLAFAVLLRIRMACTDSKQDLSDEEVVNMVRVVAACADQRTMDAAAVSNALLLPVFEAIRTLGAIGILLTASTPRPTVNQLVGCFNWSLSSKHWALREHAMTSLVKFASTVPSNHKDLLPLCLPKGMQKCLQGRLQGFVCGEVSNLPMLRAKCRDALLTIPAPRRGSGRSAFRVQHASLTVATGSFVMSMPTQHGRRAIVIFPPGEDSLSDIQHMMGTNGDDQGSDERWPDIQTLRHVSALPDGGCKMQLCGEKE
jgi:hypothetical protein